MQTRAKSSIYKPMVFSKTNEPKTIQEAFQNENWKIATRDEYLAFLRNNTWSLVPLLANRKAIRCNWIYKVKENPDGTINKYKAQLVAKCFIKLKALILIIFSPVVKATIIRNILTIAISKGWNIKTA